MAHGLSMFKLLNSNNPKTNKVGAEQLIKTTHAFRFSTRLEVNASLQHSVTRDQTESCGNRRNWDSTFTFTFLLHFFLVLYKGLETDRSEWSNSGGECLKPAHTFGTVPFLSLSLLRAEPFNFFSSEQTDSRGS